MTDLEYEFILQDRIAKIQSINEQYDLEHNSYIAFSGGKDSCVLSKLIDIALPGNNIPRVFSNTGIEYQDIRRSVVERERMIDLLFLIKKEILSKHWKNTATLLRVSNIAIIYQYLKIVGLPKALMYI